MRQQFELPVGQNLTRASLPGIGEIRGILIDNPSGQWLLILPTRDYVPPYTLGYARTFPGGIVTVDVNVGSGPAGQVSTTAGDALTIILDSEPVGASLGTDSGSAFLADFTPVLSAFDNNVAITTGTGQVVFIPAVAGRRIRLWTVDVRVRPNGNETGESPMSIEIAPAGGNIPLVLTLHSAELSVVRSFPQGLDMPVNTAVEYGATGNWSDVGFTITASYSVI